MNKKIINRKKILKKKSPSTRRKKHKTNLNTSRKNKAKNQH